MEHLSVIGCNQVRDLAPLQDMPQLAILNITTTGVEDLSPLQGVKLAEITFDPKRIKKGIEVLQEMPTLQTIRVGSSTMSPTVFWKKWEAKEFSK